MEAIATQRFLRMSPKKIRVVVNAIKNLSPSKAVETLPYMNKRAAQPLLKVVKTAIANAKVKGMNESDLVFKEIQVTDGPRLKRGRPVARGMWHPVIKRMSHIRVVLTKSQVLNTKLQKKSNVRIKKTKK
jgi:large subunit ribosomal protein L22